MDKIGIAFCFGLVTAGTVLIGFDLGWKTALGAWLIFVAFIPGTKRN